MILRLDSRSEFELSTRSELRSGRFSSSPGVLAGLLISTFGVGWILRIIAEVELIGRKSGWMVFDSQISYSSFLISTTNLQRLASSTLILLERFVSTI